jgi:ectoine hydroxylase-related dioxygenase (phytanoyl-CoA dioxygenase family)
VFSLPSSGGGPDLVSQLSNLAAVLSGYQARMVRILAFDKTPETNWGVPWHQDRTIAVKRRIEVEGFGPWSVKAGVTHVTPPRSMLERMFSLRLHLDDCGPDNGPLKIIPGSHRLGCLPVREVLDVSSRSNPMTCLAAAGDVLAMKALTIHASDPASVPAHRRVIHLDFSTAPLSPPLDWAME